MNEVQRRQNHLEQMHHEIYSAIAALGQRVDSNAAQIAQHEQQLRQLARAQETNLLHQTAVKSFAKRPSHLLFYRTLMIMIESTFLSCKAVQGGFVQMGGHAAQQDTLNNVAKGVRVCGALLSLAPGGSFLKSGAKVVAKGNKTFNINNNNIHLHSNYI